MDEQPGQPSRAARLAPRLAKLPDAGATMRAVKMREDVRNDRACLAPEGLDPSELLGDELP